MSAPCPKCGHVRQPGETGPDYECPSCGIVYAKYLAALHAKAAAAERPQPNGPSTIKVSIGSAIAGVLLAAAVIWYMNHRQEQVVHSPPQQAKAAAAPTRQAPPPVAKAPARAKPKTPEEIERERINELELAAREVCFDAIRARALFPSSVDIAWFTGTATQRHGNRTLVKAAFTSKNAIGNELPFYGLCRVSDSGQLEHYTQTPR